ncbi:MAG: TonB-dependent receptor [Terracidiphilus sp.]|jgi:hypothetical protein
MTPRRILALLGLFALIMATPIFAQSDRATIVGTIKDSMSAVMPGAQVRVTNVGTNAVETVITDETGSFRVGNLPVGNYSVTISKSGFKTLERKGITLLIGQVAEIDGSLQIGGTTETVEVVSAAPILQAEDSQVSTNLNAEAESELPLSVTGSRSLATFMFNYVPGVEGNDYSSHINGGMAMTKEVLIDGTSAVSQLGGYISESQPPMEAIQESEVDTVGISSDAGRSGGGVFKYELKSGANQYHGSAFGFMHSVGLDAVSANGKLSALTAPFPATAAADLAVNESLSDWGSSFGGALKKDKLFYYGAFERYMQSNWLLGAPSRTVPTDAMMGLDPSSGAPLAGGFADLSAMLTTSNVVTTAVPVDPTTGACAVGAAAVPINVFQGSFFLPGTNCVFANNQIPTRMISKTTAQILQLYHKYYQPVNNTSNNDAGPGYNPDPWFHNTQSSIKMDYNPSANQHIAGSFYWDYEPRINADQGGAWSATAPDGGPMANSYWHNTTAPGARLSDAITISPNMVNTVYATFNRFRNPSIAVSKSGKWDSQLGLASGVGSDAAGEFPLMYFDSGAYFGSANYENGWNFSSIGSQYNDYYVGNTFVYNDELSWSHHHHYIKAGIEFRAMQFNNSSDVGTFTGGYPIIFDPTTTGGSTPWNYQNVLGNAFASFLLGNVYSAESNPAFYLYGRRKTFGAYISDDIKVTPRLTANLSLRWDFNNRYKEKYGHWSSFELEDKNPVTGLMGTYEYLTSGKQSFERDQDFYNYSPHVGLAYKLSQKTVARINAGIFFTPLNMNTWGAVPYGGAASLSYHPATSEGGGFEWDNGYAPVTTPKSAYTAAYTGSDTTSVDPKSLTPGNTWQYSAGVQREVDSKTKVDVNWIQSRSAHLHSGIFQTNQPHWQDYYNYTVNGVLPSQSYGPYNSCSWAGSCPWYTLITPYPQAEAGYGPLLSTGSPMGNATYKSMQFSVTRRASKGLSLQGSYNWSRTRGDIDTGFDELWGTGSLQNIYDLKDEAKDISDFDVTHIVKGYVIYDLPFGRGKQLMSNASVITDALVGGWSLSGDFHYQTGTPIQVHSTNYYGGFGSVYVNLVSGCKLTNGKAKVGETWLNSDCFQNPNAKLAQLGTAGNYLEQVRNPGLATEDLGVHKSVAVGPDQRYNLTLRMEFFNVLNRDQIGGPNTNLGVTDLSQSLHFGLIQSYGGEGGRVGQFGARFTF